MPLSTRTKVKPPSGLTVNGATSSSLNVSWTARAGFSVVSYDVQRSLNGSTGWTSVATPSGVSITDSGLASGTTYYYRVRTLDTQGTYSDYTSAVSAATSSSGSTLTHGTSGTITGSGFGTKSVLTPTVRDIGAASAGSLDSQWSGATPNTGTSSDNLVNRADGFRSVSVPHSFVSRFLAGRHNVDTERSAQVGVWKDFTFSSPMYIYASFYFQVDASWDFNLDATDQNFKLANYGTSGGGIDSNTWYYEYRNNVLDHAFEDTTSPCQWHLNDDKSPPSLDTSNSNWYGSDTPNPSGTWQKVEMEILATSSAGAGYVKGWVNGASAINVTSTRTDGIAGTGRSFQLMSYARQKPGVNQYRYLADLYLDISSQACARVVLANSSTLSSATIIEPQVPTAWADGSITFTVWKGKHASGNVWAFVKNPSNSWSSAIGPLTMS